LTSLQKTPHSCEEPANRQGRPSPRELRPRYEVNPCRTHHTTASFRVWTNRDKTLSCAGPRPDQPPFPFLSRRFSSSDVPLLPRVPAHRPLPKPGIGVDHPHQLRRRKPLEITPVSDARPPDNLVQHYQQLQPWVPRWRLRFGHSGFADTWDRA